MAGTPPTAPRLRVALLGPLEVSVGDRVVELPVGQQRRALVALASVAGRVVSTDRLVLTLWGEDPPPSAVNSLQSHLARLRRTLGAAELVVRRGNGYVLALDPDDVDALAFERLVAAAEQASDPGEKGRLLDRALELWRAAEPNALAEAGLDEDVVRLGQRRLAALQARAESSLQRGDPHTAEADVRAVLAAEPLRESAVVQLVRALAADGRVAEADEVVQRFRGELADGHGLDPTPAFEEVHRQLLRGELAAPPTPEVPSPPQPEGSGAPTYPRPRPSRPRSSFHGRDEVLATVARRLEVERLTTVVGPGGVGKTRLATEVAHPMGNDAVWVDLVDARDTGDVLVRLAVAAGVATPPDLGRILQLAMAMEDSLLVLDNCEQVVDAVAEVLDALLAGSDVHVLATSRVPLHVDGECLVRLEPLATEAADAQTPPALQVFFDRAGDAVDPDASDQRAVADEVVHCLDGLPLALELAARQVRNLGLSVVRDRLHQRLDLLQAGRSAEHPAHGSLRQLVGWSTDQLDDVDARAHRLLGTFVGPFDLDQAEVLLATAGMPRDRVAATLACLVEQSLVVRAGDTRFRLLETVRACAIEDLEAAGELAVGRDAHAAAVIAAAESAAAGLATPEEAVAVARLHALVADVGVATRHLTEQQDAAGLARLAGALHVHAYHTQRGELAEAGVAAVELLSAPDGPDLPEDMAAAAWAAAALRAAMQGAAERALEHAARAVEGHPPSPAVARAWEIRGDVQLALGDQGAVDTYGELLRMAQELGRADLEVAGWVGLALAHAYVGDHTASREAATRAEVIAGPLEVPSLLAWTAYVRGEAEAGPDPEAALAAFARAVDLARSVDNQLASWAASNGAAVVRARHGDPAEALAELRQVIRGWQRAGSDAVQRAVVRNLGVLLARVGRDEPAAILLGAGGVSSLYDAERRRVQQALRAVTERLGAPTAERLRQQGARMEAGALLAVALEASAEPATP